MKPWPAQMNRSYDPFESCQLTQSSIIPRHLGARLQERERERERERESKELSSPPDACFVDRHASLSREGGAADAKKFSSRRLMSAWAAVEHHEPRSWTYLVASCGEWRVLVARLLLCGCASCSLCCYCSHIRVPEIVKQKERNGRLFYTRLLIVRNRRAREAPGSWAITVNICVAARCAIRTPAYGLLSSLFSSPRPASSSTSYRLSLSCLPVWHPFELAPFHLRQYFRLTSQITQMSILVREPRT